MNKLAIPKNKKAVTVLQAVIGETVFNIGDWPSVEIDVQDTARTFRR